jgi:hypothetical protein
VADDGGLDLAVERDGRDRVLDAGHHQQFELHVVVGTAQRTQLVRQTLRP